MPEPSYFAVVRVHGPAWDDSRPLREQEGWKEHARFMDELAREGFIKLGGPLEDGERVLLICKARDEDEVRERLAADPWPTQRLSIASVHRWTILLEEATE